MPQQQQQQPKPQPTPQQLLAYAERVMGPGNLGLPPEKFNKNMEALRQMSFPQLFHHVKKLKTALETALEQRRSGEQKQLLPQQQQQQLMMQRQKVLQQQQQQLMMQRQQAQQQVMQQQALQQQKIKEAAAEEEERKEDGIVQTTQAANSDALEVETAEEEAAIASAPVFRAYRPLKVKYGLSHPEPIVESCSMASVEPPDVFYRPGLPSSLLSGRRGGGNDSLHPEWLPHDACALSAAQLEALVYAGQRHSQQNPDDTRGGFFIGDGTGVGKGREIASIILDNVAQGRYRSIWVSLSTALYYDAKRDFRDLGRADINVYPLHKLPYGQLDPAEVGDGVMFCTYQSLIAQNKHSERRIDQLVTWAAASGDPARFEGCICFDEAHRAKNLALDRGGKGTKTGEMVLGIQKQLPQARVLYVSATAAAEVKDLGYMSRLGLWGRGTPFPDFSTFAAKIERAGVGAMELLAMDMKARGMFVSRMLAFTGCSFEVRECTLDQQNERLYDEAVELWDDMLTALEKCVEMCGSDGAHPLRLYWGAHQSFFKQLLNSIKARNAIDETEEALRQGKCVVIGLLSTGEAKANEAAERENRAGRELDSEVSTPQEIARSLIEQHLPTTRAEGAPRDGGGLTNGFDLLEQPAVPEAVQIRAELLRRLDAIDMPSNALDLVIGHFGVEHVAEMTGRKMRFVKDGAGGTRWEPRAQNGVSQDQINIAEKDAFMGGTKRVAIISDAASSGISLHADPRFANTRQRLHITLELAWSADKMLQQFGRTHRSNQITAPHYVLLVSNVGGEKRFASSVARRLEMLGAITRGDRRGGHGAAADLVQYNLDTVHGHTALALMFDAVAEKSEAAALWERALRMLQCHRQGVPTLLGLAVVAVAQKKQAQGNRDVARLPQGLQKYVLKLREWASQRQSGSSRQRPQERNVYGDCPKSPTPRMSWTTAGEALERMWLGPDWARGPPC